MNTPLLPAVTAETKKPKSRVLFLVLFLAVLIGGFSFYLYNNYSDQPLPNSHTQTQLKEFGDRLDKMQAALTTIEASKNNETVEAVQATPPAELATIKHELDMYKDRFSALEARIATLETSKAITPTAGQEQAVLKYLLLRERVMSGKPYMVELRNLQQQVSLPPALLETLSNNANQGLATAEQLISLLEVAQPKPTATSTSQNWQDKMSNQLDKLITVRKRDTAPKEKDDLASIKQHLRNYDFIAAQTAAKELPAERQAQLSLWFDTLNKRITTLKALENCIDYIGTAGKEGQ